MVEIAASPRARSVRTTLRRSFVDSHVPLGVAACLVVGALAFANGGYFPVAWGWAALALLWLAAIALALDVAFEAGPLDRLFLAALAGLACWIFVSLLWTGSVPRTVLENERMLVYLACGIAGVLLLRRSSVPALLTGLWFAATAACTYGLATRLFPDQLGVFDPIAVSRLSEPVGYWNALGLLAAMGTLLALGLAAREGPVIRCLAAGSTVILLLTLYFTFSRGAWIAFFVGLAAAIALDRHRLQLVTTALVLTPWTVIAIWVASTSPALTHQDSRLEAATRDGHGLAVIAIAMVVAAGLAILALDWAEVAVSVPRTLRQYYVGTLLFILAALLIVVFGRYGFPDTLAQKAYHGFNTNAPQHSSLNGHLFDLSGSGRTEFFHTAWQQASHHLALGGGAGTFDEYWFEHRRVSYTVHDAHSLYLETLSELGVPGLLLLMLVLGVPLAALRRARRSPLASIAFAAYLAFLVHASLDWDWEMPALTLTALLCGLALLALARQEGQPKPLPRRIRWLALGGTGALIGVALLGLLGNAAVSASSKSTRADHLARAASQARRAMHFAPWSSAPWRKLGEAHANSGDLAAARESFREAIRKDSRDWTLWFELADASRGAERRRALAEASRLNPRGIEIAEFRTRTGVGR